MQNRLRLLMGATALLYFGPLLAGLGGFGWAVAPVFGVIFILWQIVLRPHQWPRNWADWRRPEMLVGMAARSLMQVLLVTVCFAIGRGLGGVMGVLPPFSVMVPVGISFLAIPLARMIWDPWKMAEMDAMLAEAIATVEAAKQAGQLGDAGADWQALAAPILALPDTTADNDAFAVLAVTMHPDHAKGLCAALNAAFRSAPEAYLAARRGLILWATDAAEAENFLYQHLAKDMLDATGTDPALIRLFSSRALVMLESLPEAWPDLPGPGELRDAALPLTDTKAVRALRNLADAIDLAAAQADAAQAAMRPAELPGG
ncbi:MAG: hypothetical protein U1D06_04315 [Paracoccaceae bacterium]|nr:hypothetical protein [Paracoccaceae bacterium]